MAMVRPQPQPQSQLPTVPRPYPNFPPAPSHASLLRNAAFHGRSLTQHPAPQQYAHPLSRHNSYGSQTSESGRPAKPPEHMLRRKTPKGILAAAYDGTSVEKNGEPHATKHILLPVTAESSIPYALKQDLPLRSPGVNNAPGPATQDGQPDWSPSLYFETGSGRAAQHLPQIDSMLNQIPPLQPLLPYQMYGQPFSGPMGPPLQSPLGPTVSNDQGPFGPYWHDGTYIPYRPAAMRDPRFLHHHSHNWNYPQHPYMGHPFGNPIPNIPNYQPNPLHLNQGHNAFNNIGRPVDFSPYSQTQPKFTLDYPNPALPTPLPQRLQDYTHPSQSTHLTEHTSILTPVAEYGPQSINGQSREKVFAWAHTVYVDLLRYLQSTRKSPPHHIQGRTPSRPHIYPKPPRQPGADFTASSSNSKVPSSSERHISVPSTQTFAHPQNGPDIVSHRYPSNHSRPSSNWSFGGADSRPAWQSLPPQHHMLPQIPGMEPPRTLRRRSGSITSANQSLRQEVAPSMTAASALGAITKHCEESKWSWIDGILLGGCLAYALGDYQKAQDWYQHILTLDRE